MFISLLPILLLLVHGATSVGVIGNKIVPRRHTGFTRSIDVNHPPTIEKFASIADYGLYDSEETVKVRNRSVKNGKFTAVDEKRNINITDEKNTNLGTRSVNHPPSHKVVPVRAEDYDYEEDILLKHKSRPINSTAATTIEKKNTPDIVSDVASEIKRGTKSRRRSQHVRKVKVDKSQLEGFVNETGMFENKVSEREALRNEQPSNISTNQNTFKRRKQLRNPVIPIIESESYVFSHSGDFHYSYEGGDGTKAYERGELKSANGGAGSAVEGNFSYKDKDGNDVSLSYTADENGYRPVGAHLPTPPPIPPAIQRALDYLATKTTPEPITERVKTL